MSQVLFNLRKWTRLRNSPDGQRKPSLSRPSGLEPHPGAMEPKEFSFSTWTIVFTNGLCNIPGKDSAGLLIQEPLRTNSYAALRPHRKMLVSITPSVQTAINRFCPGSVDFSFRTISVLFALDIPKSKWISQMRVFFDFSGWTSPCPWAGRPNLFLGPTGVTGTISVS